MKMNRKQYWTSSALAGILIISGLVMVPTPVQAGDREWATAGKILAGAVGVVALDRIFNPPPAYAYCPPPTCYRTYPRRVRRVYYEPVYQATPVVEYRVARHSPPQVRRPSGHYEIRQEEIWVAGAYEKQWVEPVYREVWNGQCYVTQEVQPGHFERVWTPGHYSSNPVKIWVQDY